MSKWITIDYGCPREENVEYPVWMHTKSNYLKIGSLLNGNFYDNEGDLVVGVVAYTLIPEPEPYTPPLRKDCKGCPHYSMSIKQGSISILCWKHRLCEHMITGEIRREIKPFRTIDNTPCDKED